MSTTTVEEVKKASPAAAPRPEEVTNSSDGPPLRRGGPNTFQRLLARLQPRKGREYEGPVAWLLGRQMIGSIKGILLYSAYGKKLDPRDWMTARVFSFDSANEKYPLPEGIRKGQSPKQLARLNESDPDAFWFDYISDTGDGMRATYSIAYLALCNLSAPTLDPARLAAGTAVKPVEERNAGGGPLLPRGEFLFIGGDTAYHASDYMTLINRIQNTFKWAYEDAVEDRIVSPEARPRPIFGIPGNHDYYDQLDGFRRQFRHPAKWEPEPTDSALTPRPEGIAPTDTAQLILPGYYRTQEASYLALVLPHGWVLWGLDTEVGQIDERQKDFFHDNFCTFEQRTNEKGEEHEVVVPPERLIVATCSPTTAFGKLANPDDYKSADAFGQLGISQPFLPREEKTIASNNQPPEKKRRRPGDPPPDLTQSGDVRLEDGQCRLDISGDVHHYARYWGPAPPAGSLPARPNGDGSGPRAQTPAAESYASIVSGIGGAFHHPSQTYVNEVCEQSLYPSEQTSTRVVSERIFKFWNIVTGGYVWLAGAIAALVIYFAFTVPQSSVQFLHNLPHFGLGLAQAEQVIPTVIPNASESQRQRVAAATVIEDEEAKKINEARVEAWSKRAYLSKLLLGLKPPTPCKAGSPRYYFGPCRQPWPKGFLFGLVIALLASGPLLVGLWQRLYKEKPSGGDIGQDSKPSRKVRTPEGDEIRPAKVDPEIHGNPGWKIWALFLLALVMFFGGLALVAADAEHITPFGNSLLVMLTFVWAGAAVALSLRYSEFLFKKAQRHDTDITRLDWLLPGLLPAAGVLAIGFGLWAFGQNNSVALIVSDSVFVAVVLGLCIGLILLPFRAGAELFATTNPVLGFAGKLLIGLWHFVLQLAVPLVLVRKGSVLLCLAVALIIALATWVGGALLRRYSRVGLAVAWVFFGALTLALPFVLGKNVPQDSWLTRLPFAESAWTGWWGLLPAFIAAVVGAVMCCFWFGWYLGVCFVFNGHNNEVGGAARIEQFKQFIRFRLTKEGLTGYVIAVNDPEERGGELTPHVVDVFHLRPKGA